MTNSNGCSDDGFDPARGTASSQFTIDEERGVTLSIIEEMANILDCTPLDLDPLYYDVNPTALERIVDGDDQQTMSFVSNGLTVTVYGDGTVELVPAEN